MPDVSSIELLLIILLVSACVSDMAERRIPNRLLIAALFGALVLHLLSGAWTDLITVYLAGFVVGLILFLPLYAMGSMAAGDVKLMATVGAFTGPSLAFQISLATYCVGGILALGMVLAMGRSRQAFVNVRAVMRPILLRLCGIPQVNEPMPLDSVGNMPYALAIAIGTFVVMCLRSS